MSVRSNELIEKIDILSKRLNVYLDKQWGIVAAAIPGAGIESGDDRASIYHELTVAI